MKNLIAALLAILAISCGTAFSAEEKMPEPLWGDVYFASGSAMLEEGARKTLDMLAGKLKDMPGALIMLAGYDEPGSSAEASIEMGYRRVDAVREYLAANGVDPAQVKAISFGNTRGTAPETAAGDGFGNSRVRYRVAPGQDPAQMQGRPSGVCQKCKM